ncbi:MAG: PH domain-containing protein [archaeon]
MPLNEFRPPTKWVVLDGLVLLITLSGYYLYFVFFSDFFSMENEQSVEFVAVGLIISFYLFGMIRGFIQYLTIRVALTGNGILITQGIWGRSERLLLYSGIQNMEASASFLFRLLGLQYLVIPTMTMKSRAALGFPFDARDAALIMEAISKRTSMQSLVPSLTVSKSQRLENPFPIQALRAALSALVGVISILLLIFVYLLIAVLGSPASAGTWWFLVFVLVFFLLVGILTVWITKWEFSTIEYAYQPDALFSRRGLFQRDSFFIPYSTIRDVVIIRPFSQKLFGIAELNPETGRNDMFTQKEKRKNLFIIPGLLLEDAFRAREKLVQKLGWNFALEKNALTSTFPLEERKVTKKATPWVIGGIIGLLWVMVSIPSGYPLFTPLLAGILLVVGAKYFHEQRYYQVYFYNAGPELLVIRKGVFNENEIAIPYSRIENVYLDQDPLDQCFGLWDLHFATTSGRSYMEAHIDGLSEANANALHAWFMSKMKRMEKE